MPPLKIETSVNITLADLMDMIDSLLPEDKARVHREAVIAERQACWDEINSYIKTGGLAEPAHSERNGLVLACNIIRPTLEK